MTRIVRETEIDCPPEVVFGELSRVDHLPLYSHLTVGVTNAPARPVQVGDTFGQLVRVLGVDFETDWVVMEVEQDRTIRVQGTAPADGTATVVQTVEPAGSGCLVRMTVDYDPPLGILGEIADRLVFERRNEEDAERILDRLRAHCEGEPAA